MASRIRPRRLLTEQGWLEEHQELTHEGEIITAIAPITDGDPARNVELLVPALIDGHVHGGAGVDLMNSDSNALPCLAPYAT